MSAKTLCHEHGERLLAAASGLALCGYLAFGLALAREDPLAGSTRAAISSAEAFLSGGAPPVLEEPRALEAVRSQWGPCFAPSAVPAPWVPYYRTRVTADVRQGEGPVTLPRLTPPALDPPVVTEGQVTLAWKTSCAGVPVPGWEVRRRLAGHEDWRLLASPGAEVTRFTDSSVEPEVAYEYRVSALPPKGPMKLEDRGRDSEVRAVRTLRTVRFRFLGGTPDLAQVEVERFAGGGWRSSSCQVRPGEPIGASGCTLVSIYESEVLVPLGKGAYPARTRVIAYRDRASVLHVLPEDSK